MGLISTREAYQQMLPQLQAIPADQVQTPSMALAAIVHEGEELGVRAARDRAALVKWGVDPSLIDSMPARVRALEYAQGALVSCRRKIELARATWRESKARGVALRKELATVLRFVYRDQPLLLRKLSKVTGGYSNGDLVLELLTLSHLGADNPPATDTDGLVSRLVSDAQALSSSMSRDAAVHGAAIAVRGPMDTRNRAVTHLLRAVRQVREIARFAFRHDPDRLRTYSSQYRRMHRYARRRELADAGAEPDGTPQLEELRAGAG